MPAAKAGRAWIVGSQLSSIKADGDNVYVLWQNNSPDQNIYFRKSADHGNSFGDTIRISSIHIDDPRSGFGFAAGALMAVPVETARSNENGDTDAKHVYIAWMNRDPDDLHSKVLFRSSSDGGNTFVEPVSLTDSSFKGDSGIQQLLASGNNVYAVLLNEWAGENDTDSYYYDPVLRVSTDNGKTFGDPVHLVPNLPTRNIRAELSVDVSPLLDSDDNGLGNESSTAKSDGLDYQHDAVYVTWVDHGSCTVGQVTCDQIKIFFRKSIDGGKTFSDPVQIERPKEALDYDKTLRSPEPMDLQVAGSADGRNVYVVWAEDIIREDEQLIFLARSSDGGLTFSGPIDLGSKGISHSPRLVVPPNHYGDDNDLAGNATSIGTGTAYVALKYQPNKNASSSADETPRIILLRSFDAGNTFGKPIDASPKMTAPYWDVAAASQAGNDQIYVAWQNQTQNVSGLPEGTDVYFRASNDGGETFGNVLDLSDDVALKTLLAAQNKALSFVAPQIAMSPQGSYVYVAWQASYPDSSEIYVRASADGGMSFGRIISLNDQASDPISGSIAAGSSNPFFGQILTPFGLAISGIGFAAAGTVALLIFRRRKRN